MKRFEFPLERVRQYRKLELDTEHARLEQAQARLNAVDAMITDLHRQEKQEEQESREARSKGGHTAVENALQHTRFQSYLLRMAHMLDQQRAQVAQALERQRLVLLEARRRFEILDRFRQSSRAEWQAEFNREQENLAGELFLAKHARESRQRAEHPA